MIESKFKVGEAVTLIKNSYWNNGGRMDHWNGSIQVVSRVTEYYEGSYRYWFECGGPHSDDHNSEVLNSWVWLDHMMVSVENKPIMKLKVKI